MKIPYSKIFTLIKRNKKPQGIIIILLLIVFLLAFEKNSSDFSSNANNLSKSQTVIGKVVKVIDGDTVDILDKQNNKYRIRLYGIDAPESKQAYGQASKKFLSSLIAGLNVEVIIKDKDKYQRNIAKVLLNGKDINKEMVRNGYAHAYVEYSSEYTIDEKEAKKLKLGLWKDKHPMKPSDFRRINR